MWARKMNVASVLYVLARVSGPLYHVSTIVLLGFVSDTVRPVLTARSGCGRVADERVWTDVRFQTF